MTRINSGVLPQELPSKLLIAEHREITRVVPLALKRKKLDDIPSEFTLGTGHVKFFYDKLAYIHSRYVYLYWECKRRDFDVTDKTSTFLPLVARPDLYKRWRPTKGARQEIIERIESKGFKLLELEPWI